MSKITYFIRKKIGKEVHSFSVEGGNLHDAVMGARKLSFNDVDTCGLCGSDDLELSAHVTPNEGHEYTYVRCRNCRATLNFGQQKKDSDMFYLRTISYETGPNAGKKFYDWKPYEAREQQ